MFRDSRRAVALLTASLLVPSYSAHAGAAFKAVWFPNGNVTYKIASDAQGADDAIHDTMRYLSDHTPLAIDETSSDSSANLHFEATWVAPNGGGYTYAYWDENRADDNQKIRFDPDHLPGRTTIAHEFGHTLGFPHEFQRDTRDGQVDVCFNTDPFNYAKMGSAFWPDPYQNLSPYDFASVMNAGYSSCVTPLPGQNQQSRYYEGIENLLSVHDINSIYRMYGEPLGTNDAGDRFGVAVASGDYDDDGLKDVVVANLQSGGLYLSFYRGVGTAPTEDVDGLKWMPWFKVTHDDDVADDAAVTLATGDFNGDGIDDLAVGQPDYDQGRGRVSILFVNTLPSDSAKDSFEEDFAPWGRKGIQHRIDVDTGDFGLRTPGFYPHLGASLAAIRGTNYRDDASDAAYDDLAIGAPLAGAVSSEPGGSPAKGAVVILKGRVDTSPADFSVATYKVVWNPNNDTSEFGAAVAPVPGMCYTAAGAEEFYTDMLAVGAPGKDSDKGAVYVFGCLRSGTSSSLVLPSFFWTETPTTSGGRFGQALAGLRVRDGSLRTTHLLVGQPKYEAPSDGKKVGRVLLFDLGGFGGDFLIEREGYTPSTHDGQDEFGSALAVQQHAYGETDEGGDEVFVGIGMPGAKVDGVRAGKVLVWRPFQDPGTANAIEASDPDASTRTRFGASIATLRPLQDVGGFVAGAPEAIVDGVDAGQVSTLQNGATSGWTAIRRNLDQESEGDSRPTNR
jgi:FG-GAP repeat protein/astacin (peptidase family M12A)